MREIQQFNIGRLRVQEDFGFQKNVEGATALLTEESDAGMVSTYKAALGELDVALKDSDKNPHTPAVVAADAYADGIWWGLRKQVKSMVKYPVEACCKVANEVLEIMDKYGIITSLPYNEEYGRMYNLLQDLTALGVEKQKQIYIDGWVKELQSAYDAFMDAYTLRADEDGRRMVGVIKEKHKIADDAYRELVKRVNALALINGEEKYAAFIDRVNAFINDAKAVLAARKTRSENKKAEEPKPEEPK